MRGCIYKRGENHYAVVISLGYDAETGKRRQHWVTVHGTRADAEQRLLSLLGQAGPTKSKKSYGNSLGEFIEIWLRDYAQINLASRTYEGYESKLRCHIVPALGKIKLIRLQPSQIQQFYAQCLKVGNLQKTGGLSARTVRHLHMILHDVLDTAVAWGALGNNPSDAVKPPRAQNTEMSVWNHEQVMAFLDFVMKSKTWAPYHPIFYVTLFTGMRRSEVLAVRWCDFDLERGSISVNRGLHQLNDGSLEFRQPKSAASRRMIDITPSTISVLGEHKERHKAYRLMLGCHMSEDDLIFCSPEGSPLRPNSVGRAWAKAVLQSGLPRIRMHDARHTHATILLKQGVNPKVVKERLGHASVQTTLDLYSHVVPGMQRDAALQFDRLMLGEDKEKPDKK
jgi:integrase